MQFVDETFEKEWCRLVADFYLNREGLDVLYVYRGDDLNSVIRDKVLLDWNDLLGTELAEKMASFTDWNKVVKIIILRAYGL